MAAGEVLVSELLAVDGLATSALLSEPADVSWIIPRIGKKKSLLKPLTFPRVKSPP